MPCPGLNTAEIREECLGRKAGVRVSKPGGRISQMTGGRLSLGTQRPGTCVGTSGSQERRVEVRGGQGRWGEFRGGQGRCVGTSGGLGGSGADATLQGVRRQPRGQVETAWKACGEAERSRGWGVLGQREVSFVSVGMTRIRKTGDEEPLEGSDPSAARKKGAFGKRWE